MSYNVPRLSFINKILISILVGFFILQNLSLLLFKISIDQYIALSPSIFSGHIYQLITYPLVGRGIFEVIFNSLLFWLIGSELEYTWGKSKYLKVLSVGVLGGGITYLLFAAFFPTLGPLAGPLGLINLLMLAFAVLYPNALFSFMFLIPIKAKYFAMLIIGIELYMGFFSPSGASSFAHLGAMGVGYLYLFKLPKFKKKRPKRHLHLIKGLKNGDENRKNGDDSPPKYWH